MRVTKLFDNVAVANTGTTNSSVVRMRMQNDEDGILQVQMTSGGPTATLKVQGRIASDAPWVDVALDSVTNTTTTQGGYWLIPTFPEMRLSVTGSGSAGTTTVNAWIGD